MTDAAKAYARYPRYAASKLANLLFLAELDRRLRATGSPVTAVGCHPGVANTELGRHTGAFGVVLRLADVAGWHRPGSTRGQLRAERFL